MAASLVEQSIADGRAALDFITERFGADRFIVAGLCTGAVNAHRLAASDPRVVGACVLDGYAYPTRSYHLLRIRRKLERPETWMPLVRRVTAAARVRLRLRERVASLLGGPGDQGERGKARDEPDPRIGYFYAPWPPRNTVQAELESILGRGTQLLFVYTGGWSTFVGERSFYEMFPRLSGRSGLTVRYHEGADHTYFALEDREAVFADIHEFAATIR
jgi:pimeloyl-ACP methyl ester carboxylesterase